MINHGGGIFSLDAPMWSWQPKVSVGQVVKKSQQIASVDNNERSSGPMSILKCTRSPGNYVHLYPCF
jgi:murein DD-endopeptidase MepM/ murein hydrolase activator NlpD